MCGHSLPNDLLIAYINVVMFIAICNDIFDYTNM